MVVVCDQGTRPAEPEALECDAEGPAGPALLVGQQDPLGEGQQLGGQQGRGPLQVAQDPWHVAGVPLRDDEQGLGGRGLLMLLPAPPNKHTGVVTKGRGLVPRGVCFNF